MPLAPLLKANSGRWITYAASISKTLYLKGVVMPVVATKDLKVVNGIGRLQMLAENKKPSIAVVFVTEAEARLADAMLNLLSMDFDIHNRYRDLLRYNSFRRLRGVRKQLGRGFIFAVAGSKTSKHFDVTEPQNAERWIKEHGKVVLDFGAGHLYETRILRSIGVQVTPFEPYRVDASEDIDKAESLSLTLRNIAPQLVDLVLHSFMLFLHGLFFSLSTHRALFTVLHRRHAAFFHFPHAHLAHAILAAFTLAGFTAFAALSIFATFAFFTAWHFHIHA